MFQVTGVCAPPAVVVLQLSSSSFRYCHFLSLLLCCRELCAWLGATFILLAPYEGWDISWALLQMMDWSLLGISLCLGM